MKLRFLKIFILVLLSHNLNAQGDYEVSWNYSGSGFTAFVKEAESRYPVKFFFNEEWINGLTLGNYGNKPTIASVLDTILGVKKIFWYTAGKGNIILTGTYAIRQLSAPGSVTEPYFSEPALTAQKADTENQEGLTVDLGNRSEAGKPGNVNISGYITNQETGEPLAGVTVFVPSSPAGTISNNYGFYSLTLPRGFLTLRFSFVGMKEKSINLNIFGTGELNVSLKSVLVPLKETIIRAEKNISLQRLENGIEKVNIASFRLMPSSMGEADIMKSILQLPGVKSVGEGSAGFNVRGGSADQNLILLYGQPLYNSSHFFGFFSAVNPDIINDVTLYKGGIPAKYGGRLSSVLEIVPRDGNRSEFSGNAGLSPVTAHVVVEGPLKKDKSWFIVSGRTTYSDWITHFIENKTLRNSSASFRDMNARLSWNPGRKDKADISAYFSNDAFNLNSDKAYQYTNNIVSVRWRHYFSSKFFSSVTLGNSYYRYGISSDRVQQEAFRLAHAINSSSLKTDFTIFRGNNEINYGLDITGYTVLPGSYMPGSDSSVVIPETIARERAIEAALYFEEKLNIRPWLSLSSGLRLSSFMALGPREIPLYKAGFPKNATTVTDTISFGNGKSYKEYGGAEIRISLNIKLNDRSSAKLNFNTTRQYLHLLSNSAAIAPSDIWKLSDYYIKPQTGRQFALGYYTTLNANRIAFSAETYYKIIGNMVDFRGGSDFIMNGNIERDFINVEGKARGLEFMIKKPEGINRWSLGYTWSSVRIRSRGTSEADMINSGKWFPASFDRPHDLTGTYSFVPSRRVSFSASYTFSSGRPVSYPVASYKIGDIVITSFSERNSFRLPYYSRLDISIKFSGDLRIRKIAHPNWIFSVYNLTGRDNVYSAFFRNDRNTVKGYYLSVFSRPVPSLTFNFDF